MSLPDFSMKELLEAGVHFGHQTHRWNPKMKDFIYGEHNNIHIIDLSQTMGMLRKALSAVKEVTQSGGRILFVGTKRQASEIISESASQCAQYYVNHRWLGGTLTNWNTVSNSILRLKDLEAFDDSQLSLFTKKERLNIEKEHQKLNLSLGGIKDMKNIPDMLFVIDTNKEAIAIKEAKKIGIPVVAILDSNSSTDGVDFPIPGNDDASRAISLYCDLVSKTVLDGMESQLGSAGIDLGEAEIPSPDKLPDENGLEKEVVNDTDAKDKKDTDDLNQTASDTKPDNKSDVSVEKKPSESVLAEDKDIVKKGDVSNNKTS